MRVFPVLVLLAAVCSAEGAFGTWKMNPARSTLAGDPQTRSLTLRIEPRADGEVLTVDKIDADGRFTTSSSILYLDGKERDYLEPGCSGTQSSRRLDGQIVEILRKCANGEWTRFVRRPAGQSKDLVLEITEQHPDGRRFERRLVLERQQ